MLKRMLIAVAMLCAVTHGQVPVAPATIPRVTFVNASGGPCAQCTLATYTAGTTTPMASYTDSTGAVMNTNPIVLDASGGANVWLANGAYKLVLKDPNGSTIWTVDNVKGGGGLGGICGASGAIQAANGANSLTCDQSITINTSNHTLNIGTLSGPHVLIGSLGSPTNWTFDTTNPATALASLGGAVVTPGGANQIAIFPAAGTAIQGSSSIPAGITVITQSPSDNALNPASTAYVALPGAISPTTVHATTSVQVASGVALTDNQGTGVKVQHSTGATTTDNCTKFDAAGNTVDSGITCASSTSINYVWSFTSCANGTGQPSRCTGTTTGMPGAMPDASYWVHCEVFAGAEPSDQYISIHTPTPLPTTSGSTFSYAMVQVMQNGTSGGVTLPVTCYAHHD